MGSMILDHIWTRFLGGQLICESDLYASIYGNHKCIKISFQKMFKCFGGARRSGVIWQLEHSVSLVQQRRALLSQLSHPMWDKTVAMLMPLWWKVSHFVRWMQRARLNTGTNYIDEQKDVITCSSTAEAGGVHWRRELSDSHVVS